MNFVNINTVIYKIEQLLIDPVPIADCFEWIGAAMYHIGVSLPEELKISELEIKNYRAPKPCGMQQFLRFLAVTDDKELTTDITDDPTIPNYFATFLAYSNPKFNINGNDVTAFNPNHTGIRQTVNPWLDPDEKLTWNTNFDHKEGATSFFFSNIETGSIKVQYWRVMLDKDELPLLPDDESYLEACMWYCAKQLCYQGYKFKNKEFNLAFLEAKWNRLCIQSRSQINMPDLHAMQRMSNENLRLLPIRDHYYSSFKYLGTKEENARHGRFK